MREKKCTQKWKCHDVKCARATKKTIYFGYCGWCERQRRRKDKEAGAI